MKQTPLVEPKMGLLPPLHIKLGLIKQFVKKLNPETKHNQELFPKLSETHGKFCIILSNHRKNIDQEPRNGSDFSRKVEDRWFDARMTPNG